MNLYLDIIKKLVLDYAADVPVRIYLVGSRARGNARRTSDIDIAIQPLLPLPETFIINLRDLLEESTVPYSVDIIDLSKLDEQQKEKFLKQAVVWKD